MDDANKILLALPRTSEQNLKAGYYCLEVDGVILFARVNGGHVRVRSLKCCSDEWYEVIESPVPMMV